MPINVTMPALSPTMEEGNLAKWLVAEGDSPEAVCNAVRDAVYEGRCSDNLSVIVIEAMAG